MWKFIRNISKRGIYVIGEGIDVLSEGAYYLCLFPYSKEDAFDIGATKFEIQRKLEMIRQEARAISGGDLSLLTEMADHNENSFTAAWERLGCNAHAILKKFEPVLKKCREEALKKHDLNEL